MKKWMNEKGAGLKFHSWNKFPMNYMKKLQEEIKVVNRRQFVACNFLPNSKETIRRRIVNGNFYYCTCVLDSYKSF